MALNGTNQEQVSILSAYKVKWVDAGSWLLCVELIG